MQESERTLLLLSWRPRNSAAAVHMAAIFDLPPLAVGVGVWRARCGERNAVTTASITYNTRQTRDRQGENECVSGSVFHESND